MTEIFNITICDDDYEFLEKLYIKTESIVKENGYACDIKKFYDGKELIEFCNKNEIDIALLDIEMPEKNGFQTVKEIQRYNPELMIVFVSSHEEMAYQSYDYQPFGFVSKNDLENLGIVLKKLLGKIEFKKVMNRTAYIKCQKLISINTEEVLYIKSDRHYLVTYTIQGESMKFRCSVLDAYNQLVNMGFICVHRSYIVNCRYVSKINTRGVILKTGEILPVSNTKNIIEEAQKQFREFLRRSRW